MKKKIKNKINLFYLLLGNCNKKGLQYDEFTVTKSQIYMLKHCSGGELCNSGSVMINTFNSSSSAFQLTCSNQTSPFVYPLPSLPFTLSNNSTVTQCYSCTACLNSTDNIENCPSAQSNLCQVNLISFVFFL